jgi:hypothetical protein
MRAGVFPDPAGGQVRGLLRHRAWLVAPGLIGHFVHVAVIARQIAAAVHLDDELPEGERPPALPQERGHVKARWPRQPRRVPHKSEYRIEDSLRRSCGTSACFRKFLRSQPFHRYRSEEHIEVTDYDTSTIHAHFSFMVRRTLISVPAVTMCEAAGRGRPRHAACSVDFSLCSILAGGRGGEMPQWYQDRTAADLLSWIHLAGCGRAVA